MKKVLIYIYLFLGGVIVILEIYGYTLLRQRPQLPVGIDKNNVVQIENIQITQSDDILFVLRSQSIGDSIQINIKENGSIKSTTVTLVPYYSGTPIPLIYLFIGLFTSATGFLVYILRSRDKKARVFYWTCLMFSYSVVIGSGYYLVAKSWLSEIAVSFNYVTYPLVVALLLHFSFQFTPRNWRINRILVLLIVYLPSCLFMFLWIPVFLISILSNSIEAYHIHLIILDVFRIYLVLYVGISVGHLIRLYNLIFMQEQRAQIKWALYGLTIGLTPFIFLFLIPTILGLSPVISEEISNMFFIIIPVTFSIAIIKYKLMNIELVINRSLVYGLLSVVIVSIFLFSLHILHNYISRWLAVENYVLSGVAALVAASAFHPLRKNIQNFVDKAFFRLSYDYKKGILNFMERAQKMAISDQLIDFFFLTLDKVLPLERRGIALYTLKNNKPEFVLKREWNEEINEIIQKEVTGTQIFSKKNSIRIAEGIDFSQESILEKSGVEAVISLNFQMTALSGCLILGKKRSGERYSHEDIELLLTLSQELTVNLERIRLQEEVFLEKKEKKKLDELNRMKTEFITSVSHEIRTPMASIQSLSEILKEGKVEDSVKQKELLTLMGSECTRLSRFIHNILDFGKIDTRRKQYQMIPTEVIPLVKNVLRLFKPRFESQKFSVKTHFPDNPIVLSLDPDAFLQALTNILDNAIKYSRDQKKIEISVSEKKSEVEIKIKDRGIGIFDDEQKKIFENFYRTNEAVKQFPKGVGLGLKIVKHIMNAHKGSIRIMSQPGQGSEFSLIFPRP